MESSYSLQRGDGPLFVSIPHAGTRLPESLKSRLSPAARDLPDTDWHVDKLLGFLGQAGVGSICARYSRYLIDLNRPPDDTALYDEATPGLCPLTTFAGEPVYQTGQAPGEQETNDRIQQFWRPYHDRLRAELDDRVSYHGVALLLDVHSIASKVPKLFSGTLPDLNWGTNNGQALPEFFHQQITTMCGTQDRFSWVIDGRFRGGYITRHYGNKEGAVYALQLEMGQCAYLDREHPTHFSFSVAQPLQDFLGGLVSALQEWIECPQATA